MKKFTLNLVLVIMFALTCFMASCSKPNEQEVKKPKLVGFAIFQNLSINDRWEKVKNEPSKINDYITTENDKLKYNGSINFLFYVYSQNKITTQTTKESFDTNTTVGEIEINTNTISIEFERILEDTDILVYLVYKLSDESYYLDFVNEYDNITEASTIIEFQLTNAIANNVKLILKTNLSINEEY